MGLGLAVTVVSTQAVINTAGHLTRDRLPLDYCWHSPQTDCAAYRNTHRRLSSASSVLAALKPATVVTRYWA